MNIVERLRDYEYLVTDQSFRIEALESALRYVREMIGPSAPECSGCATEWGMAIAKINEVLK